MFKDISLEELFTKQKNGVTVVDVRSPSEHKDAKIPWSINIPVFDDRERAEVGTLYKQAGPEAAKERGIEIISRKLPSFVKQCEAIKGEKVVYCWRGGMRSKIAATMIDLAGTTAHRLSGGFRTYRNWVVDTLNNMDFKPTFYVLNGFTGIGKTKILQQLKDEDYPVIDLEKMAQHRGSIFGQIGLEPNNQKTFDSLLVHELIRYQDAPFVLIEGESKRIGKVLLPDFLLQKKNEGIQLYIELPIEERVKQILEDYSPDEHREECLSAFQRIKKRIHTPIAKEIEEDLLNGSFDVAVRLLLEYYYDPRYKHSISQYADEKTIIIKARNKHEAVEKVKSACHSPSFGE
ncbi:tRNA 2-selenouridine(34) synthase MnmH [Salirhabdus sp. Marseille-P4669]|uniref:tRNA 2-selenouridine(34) synthase MnmH n=1 Tax=Salirhabdus sp. Marseille-P4669 TaxID=2042310 RepID=UPI000C7DDF6D|nr:tRNA 2-selenouridine(34) synthase MnmH [Salirhabdus sp. Marseille-P4669]